MANTKETINTFTRYQPKAFPSKQMKGNKGPLTTSKCKQKMQKKDF